MKRALILTRLNFSVLFNWQIVSCAGVMLVNLIISGIVIRLADNSHTAGSGDVIPMAYIIVMGVIFFSEVFKYALSIGISRRTFFLASVVSMLLLALALAVMIVLVYLINLELTDIWMAFISFYPDGSIAEMFVWELALMLCLGMLFWMLRLIYYVASRTVKYMVSILPFVLVALLVLLNVLVSGGLGSWLFGVIKTAMGISATGTRPLIGALSFLAGALIFAIFAFLLIRRAQTND